MGRQGLTKHRKFIRLARLLGYDLLARGALEMMWEPAYDSGDPLLGTAEDIEYRVKWQGEKGILFAALLESGFIDPVKRDGGTDGDGHPSPDTQNSTEYMIHDLDDHAPESMKARKNRENERRKTKICDGCGDEYHSSDDRSKHCGEYCRKKAYKNRKKRKGTDGDGSGTDVDKKGTDVDTSQDTGHRTQDTPPNKREEPTTVFPACLNNEQFRKAWEEYIVFRREHRFVKLKPVSVTKQLNHIAQFGCDIGIQAINKSIANGWKGLFPEKLAQNKTGQSNDDGTRDRMTYDPNVHG